MCTVKLSIEHLAWACYDQHFPYNISFHLHTPCRVDIVIPVAEGEGLRLREGKQLAQGLTAMKP